MANSLIEYMKEKQTKRMRDLIYQLNKATDAYNEGSPIMTDKEWDDLYFELANLEKATDIIYPDSPVRTIYFNTISELKKVKHDHPMLSLDKTKNIEVIENFLKKKHWIGMCKMDGLTCSLTYEDGRLVKAETRGNGIEGEDITHNARVIQNIPQALYVNQKLVIDGEIICTYNNFEPVKDKYSNPRNYAAGSIRLLDSEECHKRKLSFIPWDVIEGSDKGTLSGKLTFLISLGFDTVPWTVQDKTDRLSQVIEYLKEQAKQKSYPIDGLVFKYDNVEEYELEGRTDHHFKGGLAYKFYDDVYESRLQHITWKMGRTGVLTPVAIFDPIDIEGAMVSRASLHNVSVMKETLGDCAYAGEPLKIIRSNMIIPQIIEAGPKYNYGYVVSHGGVSANDAPEYCPICLGGVGIKTENGIKRLYCLNPDCSGKAINKLDHFISKKGLDVVGLSKATLEKLIDWEWVSSPKDLFTLKNYKTDWINKPSFGETSVTKILNAIDNAAKCTTQQYICALGIPIIGKTASKALADKFSDYKSFRKAIQEKDEELYKIAGIGEVMIDNLLSFDYSEYDEIFDKYITEIIQDQTTEKGFNLPLKDKTFVITGKLHLYKNRDALKTFIEQYGGKVTASISSKTSYLINNNIDSATAKNESAKKLHIPIITEEEFQSLIKDTLETYEKF